MYTISPTSSISRWRPLVRRMDDHPVDQSAQEFEGLIADGRIGKRLGRPRDLVTMERGEVGLERKRCFDLTFLR